MPKKPRKGPVQKLRLFEGDLEIAQAIADKTKLDLIAVLSLACSAGLNAIKENDYQFPMPMKFEVPKNAAIYEPPRPVDEGMIIEDRGAKKRKGSCG